MSVKKGVLKKTAPASGFSVQENADIPAMTDAEAQEAEQRILFPELDTKLVSFGGETIELSPLPLAPVKLLTKKVEQLQSKFQAVVQKEEKGSEKSSQDESLEVLTELSVVAATFIANRYNFKNKNTWTKEELEEIVSFTDCLSIVSAQIAINGTNDFLLLGLRSIMMFTKTILPQAGRQVMQYLMRLRVNVGV